MYEGAEYGIDTAMAEKMGSVKALRAMTELYPELRKRGLRVLPGGDGYLADVLVVRGEPAADVSVLQDPGNLLAIMQGGAFWKMAPQLTAA